MEKGDFRREGGGGQTTENNIRAKEWGKGERTAGKFCRWLFSAQKGSENLIATACRFVPPSQRKGKLFSYANHALLSSPPTAGLSVPRTYWDPSDRGLPGHLPHLPPLLQSDGHASNDAPGGPGAAGRRHSQRDGRGGRSARGGVRAARRQLRGDDPGELCRWRAPACHPCQPAPAAGGPGPGAAPAAPPRCGRRRRAPPTPAPSSTPTSTPREA